MPKTATAPTAITESPPATSQRPKVAIVSCDQFSPFHLSVPCIIFGDAILQQPLFDLVLVAGERSGARAEQGMVLTNLKGLDALQQADLVIIPYWRSHSEPPTDELLNALVDCHRRGATLVGLCLGAYVLAHAGLLDGKRAATHWEYERDFVNRFPLVTLDSNALYVDCDRVITSAGTAAGLDCCLYVFRKLYGSALANRVARRMVVPPHRDGGQAQYIDRPIAKGVADQRLNALLQDMRQHLDRRYRLDELAEAALMTRRTFSRKFNRATGMSLGDWLTSERLRLAQEMLETTPLGIEQIADRSGFSSAIVFREKFKQRFAVTPKEWRKTFQG